MKVCAFISFREAAENVTDGFEISLPPSGNSSSRRGRFNQLEAALEAYQLQLGTRCIGVHRPSPNDAHNPLFSDSTDDYPTPSIRVLSTND
jgi:hypothetical protein